MPQLAKYLGRLADYEELKLSQHKRPGISNEAMAIGVAVYYSLTSKTEIARRLGIHKSNLSRMPKLDAILERMRRSGTP